ncbi:MAG: quinone-dependent dihydroorotate dehydrogenase [Candidatus Hydrogenedentes bacterium]|nr:quinone-dependent dihydroorotate dehydrogenase [Candidatus Hydrogenedentota bacterium]
MSIYPIIRPILFQLDPETAHHLTAMALRPMSAMGITRLLTGPVPAAPRTVMGLTFPNPVGLAAGLDKNGDLVDAYGGLGFGFIEVGTVTPRPQPGNPKPRLFRLPKAEAIINRMGFNNHGVDVLVANIQRRTYKGILGVSIGKNADTPLENAVDDYLACLRKVYAHADFVAANVSSPNTKNLRTLQYGEELDHLLSALKSEQKNLAAQYGKYVPLVMKIAPDLSDDEIRFIAEALNRHEIDGVIATNTTLSRAGVEDLPHGGETGGLSGAPLTKRATEVIRAMRSALNGRIPIIGVGGIMSPQDARDKLDAGAALVQVYTGLIYRGPAFVAELVKSIVQ